MRLGPLTFIFFICLAASVASGQSPYSSSADFTKYAMKLRENALLKIEPQVVAPTTRPSLFPGRYGWKTGIVTTIFWIGEKPTVNNPTPNHASSWDPYWAQNYGGYDDPDPSGRRGYYPARFVPQQNPFYCALPYNDVTHGQTKPEAPRVIPWFRQSFTKWGQSVCRNRWIAIENPRTRRIAYAQWSDCGPFRTDHWQYVFGSEKPKWNLNEGAGLDVSPAVRDYLGLNSSKDVTNWKFVEFHEVPAGPWSKYGENNDFVLNSRRSNERVVRQGVLDNNGPTVITK